MRALVVWGRGVALGELLDGEHEALDAATDGPFDPDPDDRPGIYRPVEVFRFAVVDHASGELLGSVSYHAEGYGRTVGCAAWNIGIALVPAARGRGVGTVAQRLLARYLFATTEVDRVEASTEVENVAERTALSRAGFQAEGLVRGAIVRGGLRRDYVSYAVLRGELPRSDGTRRVVVERDGVALAEPLADDAALVGSTLSEFALDPDPRPVPYPPNPPRWLAVLVDGELVGLVSYYGISHGGTVGCSAWGIGIGLLPTARGRGVGSTAQRLLVEHLLATTEVDRVEAYTDVDNHAERRALEKAGFTHEGTLRGAQQRGGQRRDVAMYGVLRSDP